MILHRSPLNVINRLSIICLIYALGLMLLLFTGNVLTTLGWAVLVAYPVVRIILHMRTETLTFAGDSIVVDTTNYRLTAPYTDVAAVVKRRVGFNTIVVIRLSAPALVEAALSPNSGAQSATAIRQVNRVVSRGMNRSINLSAWGSHSSRAAAIAHLRQVAPEADVQAT